MIMETDFSRPVIRKKEIYVANGIKYSAKDIGLETQGELYFFLSGPNSWEHATSQFR